VKGPVTTRKSQAGQIFAFVIFAFPMLFCMMGLAIDIGYFRYVNRLMQLAADDAAIAGTLALNYGDYVVEAQNSAALNGFTNGVNGIVVTVNVPPLYGPHAGLSPYVEVIITQTRSTLFMGLFGMGSLPVAARGVGYGGASAQSCVYALSPTGTSFLANGSPQITTSCGILINSSNSEALLANGTPTITARSIGIVGGYTLNGSPNVTPTPISGIVPVTDPLSYLPDPATASCSGTALAINGSGTSTVTPGANCYNVTINGTPNVTLNPGEYYGISMNGSPTVTFNPGMYVINASNISINGSGSVNGTGVTFYLGPSAGALTINGGNTTNLIAPTTGTYAGILFFQNLADTNAITFNGSNNTIAQGTIYAPGAAVTFNGTGTGAAYTIVVASSYVFNGGGTFNNNYSTLSGGSPIKTAVLVE
jgi:hypothetical protein